MVRRWTVMVLFVRLCLIRLASVCGIMIGCAHGGHFVGGSRQPVAQFSVRLLITVMCLAYQWLVSGRIFPV